MASLSAYISCPVSYDQMYLDAAVEELQNTISGPVRYWQRDSFYDRILLEKSDVFVIMLPENKFKINLKGLPNGCQKELDKAISLNKSVYLAYKTYGGTYKFYQTEITSGIISGISGTSNCLYLLDEDTNIINNIVNKNSKEIVNTIESSIEIPKNIILLKLK